MVCFFSGFTKLIYFDNGWNFVFRFIMKILSRERKKVSEGLLNISLLEATDATTVCCTVSTFKNIPKK
jgi:hypothetical protein